MLGYLCGQNGSLFSLSRHGLSTLAAFTLLACCGSARAETSLTTLRKQTRALLMEEASQTEDTRSQDASIRALCDLYVILRNDSRYATSRMLQGDAAKLRRRLIRVAQRREQLLRRQNIARPPGLTQAVDQVIAESLADARNDSHPQSDTVKNGEEPANAIGASAAGPLGTSPWQLIELIQRVIDPDLWDVQGGTATIQYFAMRRVLVVRATTDAHEQIRELLMALR